MKKDVIYIDIEDDITAVIDKLKNSSEKIVALVPPKGNAVLQSVVNLKLLKRAANNVGKQPVVVTNNQALTALAGGLDLYVAKNLQSKPVLASSVVEELPEDEEVEVSDDAELKDAGTTVPLNDDTDNASNSDEVELSGEELAALAAENEPDEDASKAAKEKKPKPKAVPNFDTFRKKLLIGGGIAILLLIVLFVLFGRAKSSIVVRAETTPVDVAFEAKFNANSSNSDPQTYNLKAVFQEKKQSVSQSFTPTGEKDLGTKATGTMRFTKCSVDDLLSGTNTTIPAGTGVSSNGLNFITQSAVTVEPSNYQGLNNCRSNRPSSAVPVIAQDNGDKFNLSARNYSVSGFSTITGSGSQMSGGTSRIVKVITQQDIDTAREALNQQDSSGIKEELKKALGEDSVVFEDSFNTAIENIVSEPGLDQQANEAKLTAEITYTLLGAPNKDMGEALDAFVVTQMNDKDRQRVYDNGLQNMKLERLASDARTATYKITSVAQYGPQFDTEDLKDQVAGKKFGEARSYLQDLPGVKGVDIKLSPFWSRKLPGANRIQISLDVDKNTTGQ